MTEPNDQPITTPASENEPNIDETTLENQAVADVIPTRSPLGLLDLPSEIRLMIFRHLFTDPDGINHGPFKLLMVPLTLTSLNIFRACRLIHREAFEVFYKENTFMDFMRAMRLKLESHALNRIPFPLVVDTIQNLVLNVNLSSDAHVRLAEKKDFLKFMRHIGRPSIIRRLFDVTFIFGTYPLRTSRWYVQALGRFTKFKTIELHSRCNISSMDPDGYFKFNLEPVLGPAEPAPRIGGGLRFHPVDHLNRLGEPDDWADHLDGLRLEWNEDFPNAKDVEG